MAERLGLRLRFALFFAALWAAGATLIAAGLWLGYRHAGGPLAGYVTAGLIGGFGLLGVTAWIAFLFDENVARPLLALAADLHTRARSGVAAGIDTRPTRYLGTLGPAAREIHAAMQDARQSLESAIAEQTARVARDRALFEALVRDLAEGVVLVSPDGRILLYNRVAIGLLGPLGLDRPLERFLNREPLDDAVARLAARGDTSGTERFLTAAADGTRILSGAIAPVGLEDQPIGHVLIFRDATEDLRAHEDLSRTLTEMIERVRRPASAMRATLDVVDAVPDLEVEDRKRFDGILRDELDRLTEALTDAADRKGRLATSHWPMHATPAGHIFGALKARFPDVATDEQNPMLLSCDGFAITMLLARLIGALSEEGGRSAFTLNVRPHDAEMRITLGWKGASLPMGTLEGWLQVPLAPAYGRYTARDALDAHRTDIWVEARAGGSQIVLPLAPADPRAIGDQAGRHDFYDFNLSSPSHAHPDRPLSGTSFVIFDTETTGLDPVRDAVVQIAAVRIVGGRLLRDETFDMLVDPGRPIPASATAIHGISDGMVSGAPDFATAATAFRSFAADAVIVAHNAEFDMAFLDRQPGRDGHMRDQPVICTARLSAALYPHTGEHTLDALADRFGVTIAPEMRHTALGDALATAEVFLKMLPVLEARGIRTVNCALDLIG